MVHWINRTHLNRLSHTDNIVNVIMGRLHIQKNSTVSLNKSRNTFGMIQMILILNLHMEQVSDIIYDVYIILSTSFFII